MKRLLLVSAVAVTALVVVAGRAAATVNPPGDGTVKLGLANPPGNNGTVKLCSGATCVDFPPQNTPHLPCEFRIEWRGYDEGDLTSTYAIVAWPPTQPPTPGETVLESGTVAIGEDPAGGANDLDATKDVDLSGPLQAILDAGAVPNPNQGWHVKLTIHAEGSIGADVKHKVVWVEDCTEHPSPTSTTPPPTTSTPPPTTSTPPPTTTTPPPTTETPTTHTSPPTRTSPRPNGPRPNDASPAIGSTAFTGGSVAVPIGIAIALLLTGLGATLVARRKARVG